MIDRDPTTAFFGTPLLECAQLPRFYPQPTLLTGNQPWVGGAAPRRDTGPISGPSFFAQLEERDSIHPNHASTVHYGTAIVASLLYWRLVRIRQFRRACVRLLRISSSNVIPPSRPRLTRPLRKDFS